jgi:hypothetical protein
MMTHMSRAVAHGALASWALGFGLLALIGLIATFSFTSAGAQNAAGEVAWRNVFRLSDGRLFATDGAMMIDASIIDADERPSAEITPSAQVIEGYLALNHPDEFTLRQLEAGSLPQSYRSPSGVYISAKYVDFLRGALPERTLRLRTNAAREPVVIVLDGVAVGVVMPLAPPSGG